MPLFRSEIDRVLNKLNIFWGGCCDVIGRDNDLVLLVELILPVIDVIILGMGVEISIQLLLVVVDLFKFSGGLAGGDVPVSAV